MSEYNHALTLMGGSLYQIARALEDFDHIDEDLSWLRKGGPPPAEPKRGPEYAIENVRRITNMICEAMNEADKLPRHPLIREVKKVLGLAFEAIGQADVPAESAFLDGYLEESVDCAREGILRAHERCTHALEQLAAELMVSASDGLPGDPSPPNQPPKPLTEDQKRALDYIREHKPVSGKEIARHIGVAEETVRRWCATNGPLKLAGVRNSANREGYTV